MGRHRQRALRDSAAGADDDRAGGTLTAVAITSCVLAQLLLVGGQLLLKRSLTTTPVRAGVFAGGIALLSGWFFVWLGLLANWDLSRLFPFEGLNPVLIALGAWLFLKERMPLIARIGIALISLGIGLVSSS